MRGAQAHGYPGPSGEQIEIRQGAQLAVVVEVGGALRSYVTADGELLDGFGPGQPSTAARGQPLIPWPNRLRDGVYEFEGRRHQLALTEPGKHNAIHGLVRWANWTAIERAEDRVTMAYRLHPQDGWPFALDLRTEYALADDGLTVTTTAVNVGAGACPYGAGAHPYLALGTETIDPLTLQAPGRGYMVLDDRGIPTGTEPVAGTRFDFRQPRQLGDTVLDTGYADLQRSEDGRARVRLQSADGTRHVALWLDEHYGYLMLFTGDSLPVGVRRTGLGVEPMTCAPNALQSGDGLRTLSPGESFSSAWGITSG